MVPVPPESWLPPVELAYQSMVSPAFTDPLIETEPALALEPFVPVGLDGSGFTVIVITLE